MFEKYTITIKVTRPYLLTGFYPWNIFNNMHMGFEKGTELYDFDDISFSSIQRGDFK